MEALMAIFHNVDWLVFVATLIACCTFGFAAIAPVYWGFKEDDGFDQLNFWRGLLIAASSTLLLMRTYIVLENVFATQNAELHLQMTTTLCAVIVIVAWLAIWISVIPQIAKKSIASPGFLSKSGWMLLILPLLLLAVGGLAPFPGYVSQRLKVLQAEEVARADAHNLRLDEFKSKNVSLVCAALNTELTATTVSSVRRQRLNDILANYEIKDLAQEKCIKTMTRFDHNTLKELVKSTEKALGKRINASLQEPPVPAQTSLVIQELEIDTYWTGLFASPVQHVKDVATRIDVVTVFILIGELMAAVLLFAKSLLMSRKDASESVSSPFQ